MLPFVKVEPSLLMVERRPERGASKKGEYSLSVTLYEGAAHCTRKELAPHARTRGEGAAHATLMPQSDVRRRSAFDEGAIVTRL
jgi:hypothetical protein